MKVLKVSEIVKEVLIENSKTRDNDEMLIVEVWTKQYPEISNNLNWFNEFSHYFITQKLFKTESITRARRKLQELHPDLRGESYKARHNHTEVVKEELRAIK